MVMAWVKLSDNFYSHPKFLQAGARAGYLAICGLAYANQHLTDGVIPAVAPAMLGGTPKDVAAVVGAGLWVPGDDGGWVIHDFAEYQPTRRQIETEREAARERMANRRRNGRGEFA
jgi:hypothetical protein